LLQLMAPPAFPPLLEQLGPVEIPQDAKAALELIYSIAGQALGKYPVHRMPYRMCPSCSKLVSFVAAPTRVLRVGCVGWRCRRVSAMSQLQQRDQSGLAGSDAEHTGHGSQCDALDGDGAGCADVWNGPISTSLRAVL
jgi:hypothetical protein